MKELKSILHDESHHTHSDLMSNTESCVTVHKGHSDKHSVAEPLQATEDQRTVLPVVQGNQMQNRNRNNKNSLHSSRN